MLNNYQVTVLAPSNKAFLKAPATFKDYGNAQQIMGYHVFSGFNTFAAIKSAAIGKKVSGRVCLNDCDAVLNIIALRCSTSELTKRSCAALHLLPS